MARKPIDQIPEGREPRDRLWANIRSWETSRKCPFSLKEIADRSRFNPRTARDYLDALTAGGWLEKTELDRTAYWRLVRDTGLETPRVRRDGSLVTQGRSSEAMWRTMRRMGLFSLTDLVIHAATDETPIDEGYAKCYLATLTDAGYLRLLTSGQYQLFAPMNTGPKPPKIQRTKAVYDANLRRVVWPVTEEVR